MEPKGAKHIKALFLKRKTMQNKGLVTNYPMESSQEILDSLMNKRRIDRKFYRIVFDLKRFARYTPKRIQ